MSERTDRMRRPGCFRNGITAHRGNSVKFPENTLPGLKNGLQCGADWVELDVRSTADGHLVVIHDETTGRTAGTDLPVASSSLRELRELDAGRVFREAAGSAAPAVDLCRIPLLGEVLALALKYRSARVSIQPKTDCVGAIVELVHALGAEDRVGFNDGSVAKMAEAHALLPAAPVFLDTGPGGPPVRDSVEIALTNGFDAVVMHRSLVTPESVAAVRSAGLQAGVWTVNDLAEARRFSALGVQRFYTDAPVALLAGLHRGPGPDAAPSRAAPAGSSAIGGREEG